MSSRTKRTWVPRLVAALLTVVFATATLLSGWSYLFCVPMHRAMEACCCHPSREVDPDALALADQPRVDRPCCEGRSLAKLSEAKVADTSSALPNPTLAQLPPVDAVMWPDPPPRFADSRRVESVARAGPSRRQAPLAAAPRFLLLCVQRC